MKVQFHHDDDVLDFLREEIELDLRGQHLDNPDHWFIAAVKNDHRAVVAVMVFEFKTWFDAHLSMAFTDKPVLMPGLFALIWRTVFSRAIRVTMLVDPANKKCERNIRKLGGQYEGFLRRGLDGRRDALVFGMLREECRYLNAAPAPRQAPQNEDLRIH